MGITRVYNNQIIISSKIRIELNISKDSVINWNLNVDRIITLKIENRKPTVKDLIGLRSYKKAINAVWFKKKFIFSFIIK